MSHKPWPDEMDAGTREIWGAVDREAEPAELIDAIAHSLDRSKNAIYSRFIRLKCDPRRLQHDTSRRGPRRRPLHVIP